MSRKALVIVDEAYNEITNDPDKNTMIGLVKSGHNVAVSRTFSKIYGLAGQRIGYIISQPEVIQSIIKNGTGHFSVSLTGLAGAISSYNDQEFLNYSKSKIIEAREMINDAVASNGLSALPSQTNFVFVNIGDLNANEFRDQMKQHGILIQGQYGSFKNWSRVSMGKIEDIQRYVDALPKVLDALGN
jgi:histidinol-phosphate aminotransferase